MLHSRECVGVVSSSAAVVVSELRHVVVSEPLLWQTRQVSTWVMPPAVSKTCDFMCGATTDSLDPVDPAKPIRWRYAEPLSLIRDAPLPSSRWTLCLPQPGRTGRGKSANIFAKQCLYVRPHFTRTRPSDNTTLISPLRMSLFGNGNILDVAPRTGLAPFVGIATAPSSTNLVPCITKAELKHRLT